MALRILPKVLLAAAAVAACSRSRSTEPIEAGVVHSTAATIEASEVVSAEAELAQPSIDAGAVRPLVGVATPGQTIEIPAATFASGSTPGDEGRVASVEPALVPVKLGAYAIDALPYPNDPAAAPALVASQEEAARLCADRGARLCTELEWEHACKGPNDEPFSTGPRWNVECDTAPSRCASGFGVRALGFLREWTDSKLATATESPVVRGGASSAHRCAARAGGALRSTERESMAFRCCHGDRNDATVPAIGTLPAFRRTTLEAADLAKILAEVPELTRISDKVRLFSDDDVKTILGRSSSDGNGISFATSPLLWSPGPGVELLVATGRAKKTGFVVALHVLPNGKYRFASSFLLLNEAAPVALAYEPSRRKELRWTTCWNCAGEQGEVSVRDEGRIVIVQY